MTPKQKQLVALAQANGGTVNLHYREWIRSARALWRKGVAIYSWTGYVCTVTLVKS